MTLAVVLKLKRFLPQRIHVAVGKQSGTLRLAGESCYWRILKQNITGEAQNFLQKCELPFPPLALKEVIQGEEEKEDPGDKTKSTTLPSTETLSWSSEYSEMYVKCLLRSIVNSSYQGSGS